MLIMEREKNNESLQILIKTRKLVFVCKKEYIPVDEQYNVFIEYKGETYSIESKDLYDRVKECQFISLMVNEIFDHKGNVQTYLTVD